MALKDDGTAWSWGNNILYRLGDVNQTCRITPVQVMAEGDDEYLTLFDIPGAIGSGGTEIDDLTWGQNGERGHSFGDLTQQDLVDAEEALIDTDGDGISDLDK